ncbi:MAG: outer membrane lipoprotein-sorting protein [Panacagrimonas sp.]
MRRLWVLGLWLFAAVPAYPSDSIEQIETCMRANVPTSLQVKAFELTAKDKTGGTRTLSGRLYGRLEEGRFHATMKIEEPMDMRGAAYLVRESAEGKDEEMYVYLPALQKVRRVTGGMRDSSLFGTDLSYADVKQITYAFSGDRLKLEKTDTFESRPMWVLSMAPDPANASRFDRVRAWIDQKTCMLLKAEFLHGSAVRKQFTSSAKHLMQAGPYWYVNEGLIEDLQEKTSTHLKVTEVLSDKDLADRLFNPRAFYLGQ